MSEKPSENGNGRQQNVDGWPGSIPPGGQGPGSQRSGSQPLGIRQQWPDHQNPGFVPSGDQPRPQSAPQGRVGYPQGQPVSGFAQPHYPQGPPRTPQNQMPYPQQIPYQQGPPPNVQPYMPVVAAPAPPRKSGGMIALIVVAIVVIGTGIGWGGATWLARGGADRTSIAVPDQPEDDSSSVDNDPAGNSPVNDGDDSEPAEAAPDLPTDPADALTQLADDGARQVTSELDGLWVPQLSSKKVGLVAEGRTWDEEAILDEYEELRAEYPDVGLIWSGDFNSFKEGNFWVTFVAIGYDDPEDALAWCTAHSLGADYCYAKQLNTSGGYEGTTRLQH